MSTESDPHSPAAPVSQAPSSEHVPGSELSIYSLDDTLGSQGGSSLVRAGESAIAAEADAPAPGGGDLIDLLDISSATTQFQQSTIANPIPTTPPLNPGGPTAAGPADTPASVGHSSRASMSMPWMEGHNQSPSMDLRGSGILSDLPSLALEDIQGSAPVPAGDTPKSVIEVLQSDPPAEAGPVLYDSDGIEIEAAAEDDKGGHANGVKESSDQDLDGGTGSEGPVKEPGRMGSMDSAVALVTVVQDEDSIGDISRLMSESAQPKATTAPDLAGSNASTPAYMRKKVYISPGSLPSSPVGSPLGSPEKRRAQTPQPKALQATSRRPVVERGAVGPGGLQKRNTSPFPIPARKISTPSTGTRAGRSTTVAEERNGRPSRTPLVTGGTAGRAARRVHINESRLRRLTGATYLKDVTELVLEGNDSERLEVIEGIHVLMKLTRLSLAHNRITKIENLSLLHRIRHLDLSDNCIGKLENLDSLVALEELRLSHNLIDRIPVRVRKHPRLRVLHLDHNQLQSLRDVDRLQPLAALSELNLSHNPCLDLPDAANGAARRYILFTLRQLGSLDGLAVTDLEREGLEHFDELGHYKSELHAKDTDIQALRAEVDALRDTESRCGKYKRRLEDAEKHNKVLQEELAATKEVLDSRTKELAYTTKMYRQVEQELAYYLIDRSFLYSPHEDGTLPEDATEEERAAFKRRRSELMGESGGKFGRMMSLAGLGPATPRQGDLPPTSIPTPKAPGDAHNRRTSSYSMFESGTLDSLGPLGGKEGTESFMSPARPPPRRFPGQPGPREDRGCQTSADVDVLPKRTMADAECTTGPLRIPLGAGRGYGEMDLADKVYAVETSDTPAQTVTMQWMVVDRSVQTRISYEPTHREGAGSSYDKRYLTHLLEQLGPRSQSKGSVYEDVEDAVRANEAERERLAAGLERLSREKARLESSNAELKINNDYLRILVDGYKSAHHQTVRLMKDMPPLSVVNPGGGTAAAATRSATRVASKGSPRRARPTAKASTHSSPAGAVATFPVFCQPEVSLDWSKSIPVQQAPASTSSPVSPQSPSRGSLPARYLFPVLGPRSRFRAAVIAVMAAFRFRRFAGVSQREKLLEVEEMLAARLSELEGQRTEVLEAMNTDRQLHMMRWRGQHTEASEVAIGLAGEVERLSGLQRFLREKTVETFARDERDRAKEAELHALMKTISSELHRGAQSEYSREKEEADTAAARREWEESQKARLRERLARAHGDATNHTTAVGVGGPDSEAPPGPDVSRLLFGADSAAFYESEASVPRDSAISAITPTGLPPEGPRRLPMGLTPHMLAAVPPSRDGGGSMLEASSMKVEVGGGAWTEVEQHGVGQRHLYEAPGVIPEAVPVEMPTRDRLAELSRITARRSPVPPPNSSAAMRSVSPYCLVVADGDGTQIYGDDKAPPPPQVPAPPVSQMQPVPPLGTNDRGQAYVGGMMGTHGSYCGKGHLHITGEMEISGDLEGYVDTLRTALGKLRQKQ